MPFARWPFLVALVALAILPAGAGAQGMTAERARMAIEETDRRIELAEIAVATSDDAQALSELSRARDLQGRAKSAEGSGQFPMAGQLTSQARGHADRAITLARGLPAPDRVVDQLERTREMLARAGERIQECGDDRARAMLRVALEMQGRAESAERGRRHLGALQLTMGARERGLRALRLCRMEEDLQETAERALRQTDLVLARAREQLESGVRGRRGPPKSPEALARAFALQDDATRQFRDGHLEASLQLTLAARRLTQRAAGRWSRPR
jgi:hypothetical protein